MSKSSTGRVDKLRQKAKDKGWKRREYYATPEEHEGLRLALDALRKGAPQPPLTIRQRPHSLPTKPHVGFHRPGVPN